MTLQELKQRIYLMKNGMVVEQMRAAGLSYKYNFGVILPQLKEIAAQAIADTNAAQLQAMACQLRADTYSRESQLIAPLLYNIDTLTADDAAKWLAEVPTEEVADVVCHALLRHHPQAGDIATAAYNAASSRLQRYGALRLMLNLLLMRKVNIEAVRQAIAAELALADANSSLVNRLTDEIDYI